MPRGGRFPDDVHAAIRAGRLGFARQKIVASGDAAVLYEECLVRLRLDNGIIGGGGAWVARLEAIGAIGQLDRHMVGLVLDTLESDPDAILGCNLSGDNFADARVWSNIYDQLLVRPALARRLVLEVTETRPLPSISQAAAMLADAQKLGCRIAVDDFGVGNCTPGYLLTLSRNLDVDIVKIDKQILHDNRQHAEGLSSLAHVVGLAACIAPAVVVEGVETPRERAVAQEAGATHQQGFLFARPVLSAGWSASLAGQAPGSSSHDG